MAKFKRETEVVGTMYLTTKDKEIPIAELHSKLEWKSLIASGDFDSVMNGERGLLIMKVSDEEQKNCKRLVKRQKWQLLKLAVTNIFTR